MERDSLDFRSMKVGQLFAKQLFPTVLGMVFSAVFIITDGIFVGRGIGSDALAAVNIAAPLFVFAAGLGLMFGMGGAIIASINLAKGKEKVANINATQSVLVSSIIMIFVSAIVMLFTIPVARMLGAPDDILELAREYLFTYAMFAVFQTLLSVLTFFVRLDAPKIAMWSMTTAAILNIILDYIFIFEFKWGLTGAAVATGLGEIVGCVMMLVFLIGYSPRVRLGRLKISKKSMLLTVRNTGYITRLGFSAFLGEAAIGVMMLTGNYVFVRYLGTDGVAAFSIVCYLFPIIFMIFNAIIQSAQPIISYNYGCGENNRAKYAFRLAIYVTVGCGLVFFLGTLLLRDPMVTLFISDTTHDAWHIATDGMPWFAIGYLFFGLNLIAVGYYMSIENSKPATIFTLLRGVIFPVICFFVLPLWWGVRGIWLAVPMAELLTTAIIITYAVIQRAQARGKIYTVNT